MIFQLKLKIFSFILLLFFIIGSVAFAEKLLQTTLNVSKLSCGSCLSRMYQKLKTMEGFETMEGNIIKGRVVVNHRSVLKGDKIAEAITSLGYPANILSTQNIEAKALNPNGNKQNEGVGCCGSGGVSAQRQCGASISTWKRLINSCCAFKESETDAPVKGD